jgi:4-amino-4-deoxy-L-arabinose transferase-like glycosyltransferase
MMDRNPTEATAIDDSSPAPGNHHTRTVPAAARDPAGAAVAGWLAALFVLALALRLMRLDAHSLWIDELFSVFWASLPTSFLWGPDRYAEPTPPVYYAILGAWQSVAGSSDFAMRLPSVLLSAATTVVVGAIGITAFGPSAGLLGAALYALSPMAHLQGQEVRVYPALVFFESLSMLGFSLWLRTAKERGGPAVCAASLAAFAGGVAAASVAFRLHGIALLFTLASMMALGGASLAVPWLGGRALLWLIAGGTAFLVLSETQLATMLTQVDATAISWMEPLSPYYFAGFFVENLAGIDAPIHYWGSVVTMLFLTALACAAWLARRNAVAMVMLVVAPTLFVALLLVVTQLLRPIWLARYGSIIVVPASILLGYLALHVRDAWQWPLVALTLLSFLLLLLHREAAKGQGRDWRPIAAAAIGDGACGGPIFLRGSGMGLGLLHYAPGLREREMYVVPASLAQAPDAFDILWQKLRPTPRIEEPEARARLQESGGMLVLRAYRTSEDSVLRGWARERAVRAIEDLRLDAVYYCFSLGH